MLRPQRDNVMHNGNRPLEYDETYPDGDDGTVRGGRDASCSFFPLVIARNRATAT